MSGYYRLRRQQLIKEAEGYLDLVLATGNHRLSTDFRHRMARRALRSLEGLDYAEQCQSRALYLRGQAFRLLDQHEQAIVALRQAEQCDPQNVHVYLALAWCYKRIDRLDLAIESLEDALAIDPDRAITHYNLACYWSLSGNVALALAHLARAFERNGRYRNLVRTERDFDAVREHPEFRAMTSIRV